MYCGCDLRAESLESRCKVQRSFYEQPALLFGSVFLGFLALSFVVAVGPALDAEGRYQPLPGSKPLTAEQRRGFEVYLAEGCPACHTQQVRSLAIDAAWGRPAVAEDYARLAPMSWWQGTPAVLGSGRTGPDLSDIGTRQPSQTWQLLHLYSPRAVSSWSVMPAFHWLFEVVNRPAPGATVVPVPPALRPVDGGTVVATARALDLVAYLASLRQARLGTAQPVTAPPSAGDSQGAQLYLNNCAACHQANGEGVPLTFPPLKGDRVVNDEDPARHITVVLHGIHGVPIDGVAYSVTMPPFGALLGDDQVVAIINHERSSWGNHGSPVTTAQVQQVRERGVQP
jgi:cytochrome c oxidase cbb3-type subunit 2